MDKTTLKSWFSKGKKPLASQFAAWIDSFWHKDEKIPISSVDGLSDELISKAEKGNVQELVASSVKDYIGTNTLFERAEEVKSIPDDYAVTLFELAKELPHVITLGTSDIYVHNGDENNQKPYTETMGLGGVRGLKLSDIIDIQTNHPIHIVFAISRYIPARLIPYISECIISSFRGLPTSRSITGEYGGASILVRRTLDAKRLCGELIAGDAVKQREKGIHTNTSSLLGVVYGIGSEQLIGCMNGINNLYTESGNLYQQSATDGFLRNICGGVLQTGFINNSGDIELIYVPSSTSWIKSWEGFPQDAKVAIAEIGTDSKVATIYLNVQKVQKLTRDITSVAVLTMQDNTLLETEDEHIIKL